MTVYIHRFLPTPGEIRTNGTVKTCANHLLSPADQPLLGERVANWAPLVILAGKVAAAPPQCTSLELQQMQGLMQEIISEFERFHVSDKTVCGKIYAGNLAELPESGGGGAWSEED